jgi:hypothetical protein
VTERYAFPVRYDDALMRAAVTGFMTRALFREAPLKTFLPLGLLCLACAALYASGEGELAVELFVALLAILGIFVFSAWRMHWRMMRERVEAMRGRFAMARLRDDGIVIDGPAPSPLLEWPTIKAIWRVDGVWLLILATNHFIALPLAAAPKEALDFLEAHVAARAAWISAS